jgi:hypothetical protein
MTIEEARAGFAQTGRLKTYIETVEEVLGLQLAPAEATRIEMSIDDCVRLGDALKSFRSPLAV